MDSFDSKETSDELFVIFYSFKILWGNELIVPYFPFWESASKKLKSC